MKVLHILNMNKLSGAEKLVLEICKNMRKYEPVVICGGDDLKNLFNKNNINAYSINFNEVGLKKSVNEIKNIIVSEKINIIHAHDNHASLKAFLAKKVYRLDVKVISHIHNCYPWLVGKNKMKLIDSIIRRGYDYNIACGKLVYDFYTENTKYINEKNTVILSNSIDVEEISKIHTKNMYDIYEEFNIPKDKTIFGFIGRLSEQKGIVPFVKEVAKNKEKFINSKILLVGNGDQENEVREIIKLNNMEDLFILTGYQDNVYKFYLIIDVFFLPSLYEGLPMVILEAMAFKRPIVSMNVGSIDEVVINNHNGYLINKENYDEFINKLAILKEDSKLQLMYGSNGYNHVLNNYDIRHYVDELIKIYNKVS